MDEHVERLGGHEAGQLSSTEGVHLASQVRHEVRIAEVGRRRLDPLLKFRKDGEGAGVQAKVRVGHDESVAVLA